MRSNVRASSPISSLPWSTIGCVEVAAGDPLRRSFEAKQPMRASIPAAVSAEHEREDQREGGRDEQPLPHELHGRERVGERRLEQDDGLARRRGIATFA